MRLIRVLAFLCLFAGLASAQSTSSITGTIKDLTGANVTSGQVTFELVPGIDTTSSGIARFSPQIVTCTINGSGLVKALDGVSICTIVQNTSQSPANTAYKACIQPQFITPGSCFVMYATTSSIDITTVTPTPAQMPAYNLVDTFSNQSIAGAKTFTGTVTFGGTLNLGAITLGGNLNMGGNSITNAAAGTFSGNVSAGGTLGVTGNTTSTGDYINTALATMKWGSSGTSSPDLGISRSAANTLACGTGAQGNAACIFLASKIAAGGTNGTGSVAGDITAARSATSGAYFIGTDGVGQLFRNGDTVSLAGTTKTWTFPAATGNVVIDSATQTLTGKTIGAGGLAGLTPTFQKFTASGTHTIASGVTAEKITICGAGGAGGGGTSTANTGGPGGGAGGCGFVWLSGLTPGNTIAVTVGTGGVGVSGGTGGTGGSSIIASGTQTITTVTCTGGAGAVAGNAGGAFGGTGGACTNSDIPFTGNNGMFMTGNTGTGQLGAASIFGGAPNGAGTGNNPGNAGNAPGAGGSGGGGGTASTTGGAGANGIVIFEWTK